MTPDAAYMTPSNYDNNYNMNFKMGYTTDNLTKLLPLPTFEKTKQFPEKKSSETK